MGAAYYIVLDNPNPGFDPFVNGKGIARNSSRLSNITRKLKLKTPDEFVSISPDEAAAIAEEFGVSEPVEPPPEQWFAPEEGLQWVTQLREHLQANPSAVKDASAVLNDLAEYEQVFQQAKSIGARWHLWVDF